MCRDTGVSSFLLRVPVPPLESWSPDQCSCSIEGAFLCQFLQAGPSFYFERWSVAFGTHVLSKGMRRKQVRPEQATTSFTISQYHLVGYLTPWMLATSAKRPRMIFQDTNPNIPLIQTQLWTQGYISIYDLNTYYHLEHSILKAPAIQNHALNTKTVQQKLFKTQRHPTRMYSLTNIGGSRIKYQSDGLPGVALRRQFSKDYPYSLKPPKRKKKSTL